MLGIIHIGTEKTGSSSIQDFIATSSDCLREAGVATLLSTGSADDRNLVTYSMNSDLVDDHVSFLGIEDASKRAQWRKKFREDFLKECCSYVDSYDALLLSSEHFHSRLSTQENVAALFDILSEVCSEFRIIVYLRRQDRVAASLASTYFKTGLTGGMEGYHDHLQRLITNSHYFDYAHLLSIWSNVFGEQSISPRVYRKDKFHENDLISDFLYAAEISIEQPSSEEVERNNVSLSNSAIMALEAFSEYFPVDNSIPKLKGNQELRARFIQHLEDELSGYPGVFSRKGAERFYSLFSRMNNEIARRWFDSNSLFEENFSMYPGNPDDSADFSEQLNTVLAFFANEVETISKYFSHSIESDTEATESDVRKF